MAASRKSRVSRSTGRKPLSKSIEAVRSRARRAGERRRLRQEEKKNEARVSSEWLGARGEGEPMAVDTPDRPALVKRAIDSNGGSNDHHLDEAGAMKPGLNGNAGYAVVDSTALGDKLRELRDLVGRLERVANADRGTFTFTSGEARAVMMERDDSDSGPALSGTLGGFTVRIDMATQSVQGARNLVRSCIERLYGPIVEKATHDTPHAPRGGSSINDMSNALDHLELELGDLHQIVDRLSSL